MAITLDSKDIAILVHLWQEGARICEIAGNEDDNRRRIYRLRRAGLCGCSPQQGFGGHRAHIWGINPAGIEAIELSEEEYAGRWREDDFNMVYPPPINTAE